ncbi:FAD-dependent oxidoreductase [Lacrimispora saccharolytica]|uniref:FAD dependent oxidoreductase n=1 Tax=Lacrimispora saccharolytica (strain ATCC 35040 / DSM 2544 / NRCC 2533 / WM1) TaxID=610130 RepID=D9QZC1_LACSW|nr:FAD-dependent oxidoreductase [Lacrimispora saccharolytica]ADL04372.1 FAD dependent oxidoreductase [[Clostridium] saccharolyticum WM1]
MKTYHYDFVVVGGGMSGVCAAIAAARRGTKTALIHDRPVLGGNASSEIRMHICGADHHMSVPNARETGILEEILLENKRRNPEMVYPIFDSVLWEKVHYQENLTLFLNTHMTEVLCDGDRIEAVCALQMTTEKTFCIFGTLFLDATGDGVLGAKAGAEYRIGRESSSRYGESLAPDMEDSCTMGNSLMFKARDMGHEVPFIKPFWANTYTEEQLRLRDHSDITSGYWWIELGGGERDVISHGEELRDELLKAVFGVWDHIKNGGEHGAERMELEWVGFLPGKRESRRLIGDYVLTERDCLKSPRFDDAVAYGGWPMDIHTVEGFLNESGAPTVWNQVNGIYSIPYRCLYSKNIRNLFLGGRAISCSHVAFSSTRVMGTCAVVGQAAGTAAAMAGKRNLEPRELLDYVGELQQELLKDDCYIPFVVNQDPADYARQAAVTATHHITGWEPEKVINGVARTVEGESNGWRAPIEGGPSLVLTLPERIPIREIRLMLDSNLSREITQSINQDVLSRQKSGPPSELLKEYEVDILLEGKIIEHMAVQSQGQRLQRIFLNGREGNAVRIKAISTYGSREAVIFEVRIY